MHFPPPVITVIPSRSSWGCDMRLIGASGQYSARVRISWCSPRSLQNRRNRVPCASVYTFVPFLNTLSRRLSFVGSWSREISLTMFTVAPLSITNTFWADSDMASALSLSWKIAASQNALSTVLSSTGSASSRAVAAAEDRIRVMMVQMRAMIGRRVILGIR